MSVAHDTMTRYIAVQERNMARILLLEDDEILSQTLTTILKLEGHEVCRARDGKEAYELTFSQSFDLYLLDVNVPMVSGFEVLRELRNAGDSTPAFFITALNDIGSISQGFDVGANDYIKKPFDLEEFLIRVRAALKSKETVIHVGEAAYNPLTAHITVAGIECDLSPVERAIFGVLVTHRGRSVEKERLFEVMEKPSDAALRVHVNRLKQKLGIVITNQRSVGYRLELS